MSLSVPIPTISPDAFRRLPPSLRKEAAAIIEELERRQSRILCTDRLIEFHRQAWPLFDPAPFEDNWHLHAIAEHLEAVTRGKVKRLLINMPPRCSKSSLVCVSWPAWTFAQGKEHDWALAGPQVQFLFASYAQTLSERDSLKTRRLLGSDWYAKRWPLVKIASDKDTVRKFETTQGGCRLATSTGGTLTGEGGDILVVDDPIGAKDANYQAVRDGANVWWDEVMSSRLNNPVTGAKVVIMQRLHEEDLSGHILDQASEDWVHLMLPMRHDTTRVCVTDLGFEDPRQEDGELLWPSRFPEEEVSQLEATLGPYATAGQLQQAPSPRGGGIIRRDWWNIWDQPSHPKYSFVLGVLDTALTEKAENDPSGMQVWGVFTDERAGNTQANLMLAYAWNAHLPLHMPDPTEDQLRALDIDPLNVPLLEKMAALDKAKMLGLVGKVAFTCWKYKVKRLLVENKANGITVSQELKRLFRRSDFVTELYDPTPDGDKVARLHSVVPMFTDGMIWRPDRHWAQFAEDQITSFPKAKHDEMVDCCSCALTFFRRRSIIRLGPEIAASEAEAKIGKRPPKALYPMA